MAHKGGELRGVQGTKQKVIVVAENDKGAHLHVVEPGGTRKDPENDRIEPVRRPQEESALKGPGSHLDQWAFGRQEAHRAAHASYRRNPPRRSFTKWAAPLLGGRRHRQGVVQRFGMAGSP